MSTLAEFLTRCLDAAAEDARIMVDDDQPDGYAISNRMVRVAAMTLATVDAQRTVLTLHDGDHVCGNADHSGGSYLNGAPCPTLLALAQPYRGEDGWREEWQA